ncbi:MAG: hypothetical protein WC054_02800 [Candidatus Nanopelagicales bacterium]
MLLAFLVAESLIPDGAVDFAQDLQILLLAVAAFTTAVVGTVIPILVAVRKLIVGPTEARITEIDGRVARIEETAVAERAEMKLARAEDRIERQKLSMRQAQIGGALGLDFND